MPREINLDAIRERVYARAPISVYPLSRSMAEWVGHAQDDLSDLLTLVDAQFKAPITPPTTPSPLTTTQREHYALALALAESALTEIAARSGAWPPYPGVATLQEITARLTLTQEVTALQEQWRKDREAEDTEDEEDDDE